jgi:cytochrome c-type biogenesis protein CcmH
MANTLAEHESGPSTQMRREIRTMLAEGRSEREILDHYLERYGAQILSAPEARGFGLTAYLVPFVLLVGGSVLMLFALRRWAGMRARVSMPATEPQEIDPEHLARLERDLQKLD